MSKCIVPKSLHKLSINFAEHVTITHKTNQNFDELQKELLRWHYHLGHISLQDIQALLQTGALATTHAIRRLHKRAANLKHADRPKCASCLFGKQTSQAKPGKRTTVVQERDGILSADKLHPGQRVFVDHFMCST